VPCLSSLLSIALLTLIPFYAPPSGHLSYYEHGLRASQYTPFLRPTVFVTFKHRQTSIILITFYQTETASTIQVGSKLVRSVILKLTIQIADGEKGGNGRKRVVGNESQITDTHCRKRRVHPQTRSFRPIGAGSSAPSPAAPPPSARSPPSARGARLASARGPVDQPRFQQLQQDVTHSLERLHGGQDRVERRLGEVSDLCDNPWSALQWTMR
jgi:hypothetical protein